NYTIIRQLAVRFGEGFSVITGETGEGKSVLTDAIAFVLGQRAVTSVLYDKSQKSYVEAVFRIEDPSLSAFFTENDLDFEEECILRREITPQGKSRNFINDTPVPLSTLRQLSERLIDIHSQHANLLLRKKQFQLQLIDRYGHLQPALENYRQHFLALQELQGELQRLQTENNTQDIDYISFLYNELESAHLSEGEQQSLEDEWEQLTHAEEIKQWLYEAGNSLDEADDSLIGGLQQVQHRMQQAARYRPVTGELSERMESAIIELKDIAAEIRNEQESVQYDPERAENIRQRLNLLNTLQQKHRVQDEAGLLQKAQEFRQKLQKAEESSGTEQRLLKQIAERRKQLEAAAEQLHSERQKVLPELQEALRQKLIQLQIPNAQLQIDLIPTTFNEAGSDEAQFLFSANTGMTPQPLAKIASGGEISRVMLAVKAMISMKNLLPTILFDEIDTGISGEVSAKMADVMRDLSRNCQVIAITHQPQIAARADSHYLVFKESDGMQTQSDIRILSGTERREAIARMVGDGAVTGTSLQMADALMQPCANGKKGE
ncbi:MAG: DNA repair protein RecN, partial [Bacteroidales bacterium]|nr:DNA repair protein RecN [Bacteroidales bacterium]